MACKKVSGEIVPWRKRILDLKGTFSSAIQILFFFFQEGEGGEDITVCQGWSGGGVGSEVRCIC